MFIEKKKEITVNPLGWTDYIFLGIRILVLCFYTFPYIYLFFVFLPIRMYCIRVSRYIFTYRKETYMKNYLNPHPFWLLCNREYVLRMVSSWTIWTTHTESAFLHEVLELPLSIVAIYTSPMKPDFHNIKTSGAVRRVEQRYV